MRARTQTIRRRRQGERGAALLLVMVAVAILAVLGADLAYETRVRLQIAGNARDALRAEALARSGVAMSRLVLTLQAQVDQASGQMCGALNALTGQATGQPQGGPLGQLGGAQGGAGCPRLQLWSAIPVSSGLIQALFGGAAGGDDRAHRPPAPTAEAPQEAGARAPTIAFGEFEGAFDAKISDEGTKVNLQLDALAVSGLLGGQVEAYLRLVCDPKWDPLFDREDANGQKWSRQDVAVHLRDWTDGDPVSSSLAASYPGGGQCSFVVPQRPFEQGTSDENFPYDRGPERYKAKNARLDSLDELHLIGGIGDAFMAAFGDLVTVYLPKDAGLNVNADTIEGQLLVARLMADPAALPLLADPAFPKRLHDALSAVRMGGLLTITGTQFAGVLAALGVPPRQDLLRQGAKTPFTDRSSIYRIQSVGLVGDVEKKIDAVVSFEQAQNQGPDANKPLPGRLIRWREE